jgi:hypothetical protein
MLAGFALLMGALTGIAVVGLSWGWPQMEVWRLAPRVPFKALPALPDDAYAAPAMWVARPGMATDPAQYLPPGVGHDRKGGAFVFFLHPTTYIGRKSWNAPLDHPNSRMRADLAVRSMASVFNDEAGIYAPRYRQAALGTFLSDRPEQQHALALAQSDAKIALTTFLRSVPATAPIVLAGHDQGALILMRLIRDTVLGTPLAPRVIAVYLAGWPISARHDLPELGMPACTRADQAGCVMSWITFATPGDPREVMAMAAHYPALDGFGGDGNARDDVPICTNPLTGGASPEAPASANLGSLAIGDEVRQAALVRPSVGARCDSATGLLTIVDPPHLGDDVMPGNNYSVYDFPLFWRNLRNDIARREAAWMRAHRAA